MAPIQCSWATTAWSDPAANQAELVRFIDEAVAELRAREDAVESALGDAATGAEAPSAEAAEEATAETFPNEPGAPVEESQEAVVEDTCVMNPGNRSET